MIGNRDAAVRISVRELRRAAGLGSRATLHSALKALEEARLVYRISTGESTMPGVLALRLPEGYKPEPFAPPSPAPSIDTALYPSAGALGALHQLRHGYGLGKLAFQPTNCWWRRSRSRMMPGDRRRRIVQKGDLSLR